MFSLHWRHNERDGVSLSACWLLDQTQIKENIKAPCLWPFVGNSPVAVEFPAQRANNAGNVSIWWCHHGMNWKHRTCYIKRCFYHIHSISILWVNYTAIKEECTYFALYYILLCVFIGQFCTCTSGNFTGSGATLGNMGKYGKHATGFYTGPGWQRLIHSNIKCLL